MGMMPFLIVTIRCDMTAFTIRSDMDDNEESPNGGTVGYNANPNSDDYLHPNGGTDRGHHTGLRTRGDSQFGGNGASVGGPDYTNNPTGQEGVQRLHGEQAPPLDPTGEVDVMNDLSSNHYQHKIRFRLDT